MSDLKKEIDGIFDGLPQSAEPLPQSTRQMVDGLSFNGGRAKRKRTLNMRLIKRISLSAAALIVSVAITLAVVLGDKPEVPPEGRQYADTFGSVQPLLAKAAVKAMDDSRNGVQTQRIAVSPVFGSAVQTRSTVLADEPLIYTYPITGVAIFDAFEFAVFAGEDNDFILDVCGGGYYNDTSYRVIIASFIGYKDAVADISDTLIVVVGESGIYHSLVNSGGMKTDGNGNVDYGTQWWEFSGHKIITSDAVIKNFEFFDNKIFVEMNIEDNVVTAFSSSPDRGHTVSSYSVKENSYFKGEDNYYDLLDVSAPSGEVEITGGAFESTQQIYSKDYSVIAVAQTVKIEARYFTVDGDENVYEVRIYLVFSEEYYAESAYSVDPYSLRAGDCLRVEFFISYFDGLPSYCVYNAQSIQVKGKA